MYQIGPTVNVRSGQEDMDIDRPAEDNDEDGSNSDVSSGITGDSWKLHLASFGAQRVRRRTLPAAPQNASAVSDTEASAIP
jgi:hypothetical protein